MTNYPIPAFPKSGLSLWFAASLAFAALYGGIELHFALSSPYVVEGNARVFLIWLQRFTNPALLPGDLIADYFETVTPWAYGQTYHLAAILGLTPLEFSRFLPIVLGVITAGYAFWFCFELFPVPSSAFIGSILLSQSMWFKDDLLSATPRAFLYPILTAFLYYSLRDNWFLIHICVFLIGTFYPPILLLVAGVIFLRLGRNLLHLRQAATAAAFSRRDLILSLTSLGLGLLVMLAYAWHQNTFGPIVTGAEARSWPEFSQIGRIPFFDDAHPWHFWFKGIHSGIKLSINPPLVAAALVLPWLIKAPDRFPLARAVNPQISILVDLTISSFAWFFIAHLLIFNLYLPSRYTQHSLKIILAAAAGIAITLLLDALRSSLSSRQSWQRFGIRAVTLGVWVMILFYPNLFWQGSFPDNNYVVGTSPPLYAFLQQQPLNTTVASLAGEADNVPIFGQRLTLVGEEYADPYDVGYYLRFRRRVVDLINAQYSPSLNVIRDFIHRYHINFWLLEKSAFEPGYISPKSWLWEYYTFAPEAISRLNSGGGTLALAAQVSACSVLTTDTLWLLDSQCLLNRP